MKWTPRNDSAACEFYSSICGRWDLFRTPSGAWLAIDWDTGRTHRGGKAAVIAWCVQQTRAKR